MKYKKGDLLQDKHPEAEGKNKLIIILQATKEGYIIWKGATESIVDWDREGLEEDPYLAKVEVGSIIHSHTYNELE